MAQTSSPPTDVLDQEHIGYIDVGGRRTRYYENGSGEPLVLVHGGQYGSLFSLDSWSLNLPALAERFHVYAIDKLGQGYTDNPESEADYSIEALVRHLADSLEILGVKGAHLVGHSRGALAALRVAQDYPGLAKSLVLMDTNTVAPNDPSLGYQSFYGEVERKTPPGPPSLETVRVEPEANSYGNAHLTANFLDRMLKIARLPKTAEGAELMKTLFMSTFQPSLDRTKAEALGALEAHGSPVPTLIIWGFNDPSAPLVLGHRLMEIVSAKTPQTEMHVLNQAGHYSFREQPEAFHQILSAFCLR